MRVVAMSRTIEDGGRCRLSGEEDSRHDFGSFSLGNLRAAVRQTGDLTRRSDSGRRSFVLDLDASKILIRISSNLLRSPRPASD